MQLLKDARFRVFLYVCLFLFFYFLSLNTESLGLMCPFNEFLGIECPGCGTTRAFLSILRFDFETALHWNPLFVLFIFPVSVVSFVQDTICMFISVFTGVKRYSFIDFVFYTIFGE